MIIVNTIYHKFSKSERSPLAWLVIAIFSFIGQACSPFSGPVNKEISDNYYYSKTKSEIRYSPMGNWFELGNTKIEGADVATFQPLSRDFAKDHQRAYFKEHSLEKEVDFGSFDLIDSDYVRLCKDKDHVYLPIDHIAYEKREGFKEDQILSIIEGADPATYEESEDWDWAKDAQNWFYRYKKIDVDYETFEPINENFCKDKHTVYLRKWDKLLVSEIDASSFKTINDRFVADSEYIYDFVTWEDQIEVDKVNKFTYKSFASVDHSHEDKYLYFDQSVLYDGKLIREVDRKTFKVMDRGFDDYATDNRHVYFQGAIIDGADVKSFKLYENEIYARDHERVYHLGKEMKGVDLETFGPKDKDKWIYRDKNHIYVGGEIRDDYPN